MILLGQEMVDRLVVAATIICQLIFSTLSNKREGCYSLTTDDRSVDLNARPNEDSNIWLYKIVEIVGLILIVEYFDQIY